MQQFQPLVGILAGGESRRFGQNKATAELQGHSLLFWSLQNARKIGGPILLNTNSRTDLDIPDDVSVAGDIVMNGGPLGGVSTLLARAAQMGHQHVLILPIDVPVLPNDFWAKMVSAAKQEPDSLHFAAPATRDAWLCSIWPTSMRTKLDSWLATGQRRVRGFLTFARAKPVLFPVPGHHDPVFFNINRPSDLEVITARIRANSGVL